MAMEGKGGPWTERKLRAVGAYLEAFNIALKKLHFSRVYIDAFAGSGDRALPDLPLLDNDPGVAQFAKGSVRIALDCKPEFHRLVFIEKSARHVADLEEIAGGYPGRSVEVCRADANQKLIEICGLWDSRRWRGVLFVDPYGCQVEWRTLEAVARTKAIDVWLLFPVNAVRRMLPRDAEVVSSWRRRLTLLFGTDLWFDTFYRRQEGDKDLFGHAGVELEREVSIENIESYYGERLDTIFAGGVSKKALRLGPTAGEPLFSLFFACSNPSKRAKTVAFRIANHILDTV